MCDTNLLTPCCGTNTNKFMLSRFSIITVVISNCTNVSQSTYKTGYYFKHIYVSK